MIFVVSGSSATSSGWPDEYIGDDQIIDSQLISDRKDGVLSVTTMIQSPPVVHSTETVEELPDGTIVVKKSETISRKQERIVTSRSHSRQNLVTISTTNGGQECEPSAFDCISSTSDGRFAQNVRMEKRIVTGGSAYSTQLPSQMIFNTNGEASSLISTSRPNLTTTANQLILPRNVLPASTNFFEQQRLGSVDRFNQQLMTGTELSLMSNNFVDLLNEQRQYFESAFPAFKHLRTGTTLFSYKEQYGGTTQVSQDGLSSRSTFTYQKESSIVTRTTNGGMINGTESLISYSARPKMTTRAYFQYQGPKGTFKLMLDDE